MDSNEVIGTIADTNFSISKMLMDEHFASTAVYHNTIVIMQLFMAEF